MKTAWLKERKNYIGASDISVICGKNRYSTPLDLYWDKKDPNVKEKSSKSMIWGTIMEEPVAQNYAQVNNCEVEVSDGPIYHPKYPFIAVNIDRWVNNRTYLLECKTAASELAYEWGKEFTDEIPIEYKYQVAYQRAVVNLTTPVSHVDIAVLIGGNDDRIYRYMPDLILEEELMARAVHFWNNHILPNIPPPPLRNSDFDYILPTQAQEGIRATQEIAEVVEQLTITKEREKFLETQKKDLQFKIKSFMDSREILLNDNNKIIATWKFNKETPKFNVEKLKESYPELYEEYTYFTTTRMLLIK